MGKAYGLNTQVLLANLQHFCCNNNIIILNYYYFIPGLFPSHSWWAESCSVRLSRGMVCSRQPRSFQGADPHGRPDGWTEDGWRDARIQGRLHFSSRRPLLYRISKRFYSFNFFCFNFFILLKWWSSIRIFSQIWWYSKYGCRKILYTLVPFMLFQLVGTICGDFLFYFWQIFFSKNKDFMTEYSFVK